MTIALDIIMIGLLIAVIIRMIDVNNKIKNLKNLDGEISPLLRTVSDSLKASSAQIELLKKTTQHVEALIADRLEKGNELKSDLDFMMSHGNKTADRLENILQEARGIKAQKLNQVVSGDIPLSSGSRATEKITPMQRDCSQESLRTETASQLKDPVIEDMQVTTKAITKDSIRLMLMEKFQDGARRNA